MRIGILVDRLEVGGVEKVAIQQVAALRDLGHDAELLVLRGSGDGWTAFAEQLADIPVRVLERRLRPRLRGSLPVPGFAFLQTFHFTYPFLARRLARAGEWDVIVAHGTYTCLTGLAIQSRRGIPLAAFIWDPVDYILGGDAYADRAVGRLLRVLGPLGRLLDRGLVRGARLVLLGGDAHAPYVRRLRPRRLLVQHPSAEPAATVVPHADRSPDMLSVTAWKHGKAPEALLEPLARHPRLRLVLAGDWLDAGLRERFEQEVARRGVADRVELTGRLGEAALAERYARARFVVQAFSSPGFGLSALEAAAHATPFVIPRGQGSSEVFRDEEDGLFYDLGDAPGLADAIARLADDDALVERLGTSARERVARELSSRAAAQKLADALRESTNRWDGSRTIP